MGILQKLGISPMTPREGSQEGRRWVAEHSNLQERNPILHFPVYRI